MTKEDWSSLQACPGWDALKRYLMDYRESIKESWARGHLRELQGTAPGSESDGPLAAQLRCEILGDLATIEWASIAKFYDLEPEKSNG